MYRYILLHTNVIYFYQSISVLDCLIGGNLKLPISVPIIALEKTLDHFNILFAHLFAELGERQGMSAFDINPFMLLTISALLDSNFPAIQSTDKKPTRLHQ